MMCFLSTRRPPRSTRIATPLPYTTSFRSPVCCATARLSSSVDVWCFDALDLRFRLVSEGSARSDHPTRRVCPRAAPDRRTCARLSLVERGRQGRRRPEEHTSELQSLMRISYALFCLKKKKYQSLPLL